MKKIIIFSFVIFCITACKKSGDLAQELNFPFITSKNVSWTGDKVLLNQLIGYYTKTKDEQRLAGNVFIQKSNSNPNGEFDENTFTNTYIKGDSDSQAALYSKGTAFSIEKQQNGVFKVRNSEKDKYKLFGETIKIESNSGVILRNDSASNWSASMYVPKPLIVTNFNPEEQLSKSTGKQISWVPDNNPANNKGVILRLLYDPLFEKSFPNTDALPSESIERYITVADNGNYQLNADDLRNFPAPLHGFEITIFRGNFQISDTNRPVAVCAFDYFKTYVQLKN